MPLPHNLLALRNSRNLLQIFKNLNILEKRPELVTTAKCFSSRVTISAYPTSIAAPPVVHDKKAKVSKAMKAYLERSTEHKSFMKAQTIEYQIGKRHLANMMGEDAETFTQDDVNAAVQYLFPSGIYDKKARPLLAPPEEIFPQQKAAQFDETGRPHHSMFYTGKPNFFQLMFDIVSKIQELSAYEDAMLKRNIQPDPALKLDLRSSNWLSKEQLENHLVEMTNENDYRNFQVAFDRLLAAPFSYVIKDFIVKYRKEFHTHKNQYLVTTPQLDEDGRHFVKIYECLRKRARGDVTIRSPGTGRISINGNDITYFEQIQSREQVLFPLIFTNLIGKVDVEANVEGGGWASQAGAIRWGISMGVRSFLDDDIIEQMRLAGLLQRDYRKPERKKPGQEGARRKFTWKKR